MNLLGTRVKRYLFLPLLLVLEHPLRTHRVHLLVFGSLLVVHEETNSLRVAVTNETAPPPSFIRTEAGHQVKESAAAGGLNLARLTNRRLRFWGFASFHKRIHRPAFRWTSEGMAPPSSYSRSYGPGAGLTRVSYTPTETRNYASHDGFLPVRKRSSMSSERSEIPSLEKTRYK